MDVELEDATMNKGKRVDIPNDKITKEVGHAFSPSLDHGKNGKEATHQEHSSLEVVELPQVVH